LFAYQTSELVRVNGPYHEPIKQARDLLVDVSPSRLDLGETRLTVYRLWEAHDRAEQEDLIRYGNRVREEYDQAHEGWAGALPAGNLKQKLIVEAHRPAVEYFDARDRRFIPALLAGNREAARAVLEGTMRARFREHRAALTEAQGLARENLAAGNARVA